MIRTKVKVQLGDVAGEIERRKQKAQAILDEQILKDSNYYAPLDTSELINSSLRMSLIGQGVLTWATPYARRLYYNPQYNFQKDRNPNAGGLWFERAKASHLNEWIDITAREMGGRRA